MLPAMEGQFAQMNLQNAPQPSAPRSKRPARAYHTDDLPPPQQDQRPAYGVDQQQMQPQWQQPQLQHQQQPGELQPQLQQQYALPTSPSLDPRFSQQPLGNIDQPSHSAGQPVPEHQRRTIDVDQIPSPVLVQAIDQHRVDTVLQGHYMTCSHAQVPLALSDYVAVDQGNCTPRFLRMTTYTLPATDDLAVASHLPLALIVQPFARVQPGESPVPVVDFSEHGPPRCFHCRGYINPWCTFIDAGQRFACNLCGGVTDVPPEYFAHVDMNGNRVDVDERPELQYGSVDMIVPKDYWVQPSTDEVAQSAASATPVSGTQPKSSLALEPRVPEPIKYIFAIDVSFSAAKSHMIGEVVDSIRELLYGSESESPVEETDDAEQTTSRSGLLPVGAQVAIMTFDRTVQFYNLSPALEQAQMMVVSDLDDMFVPLYDGLLVDPIESRHVIEPLLTSIKTMFQETPIVEAALGAAVKASLQTLKRFGGQVNIFQSVLPTVGPGALKQREDQKLYGTDKEKTLFTAQDALYRQLGEECADAGIGVNLFVFPTQYIDVASIGVLAGITGGEIFFHPRFDPVRESHKLRSELKSIITRETGYSVTMRIRCSNGLRVADHFGNFFQRNVTDIEFGTLDADKAIAALIKHEGKVDDRKDAYIQCAVLHTTASGQRRVRCHNIALPVSNKLGGVFKTADMDTTISFIAKEAITHTLAKNLRQVRDSLMEKCVKVLLSYRKHCASATSPGQLILPESLKLFPLYALAVMKTKALKGGPVASDVRTYYMRMIKSMGVSCLIELLYPRFFPIHNLHPEDCTRTPEGIFRMPLQIRTSYQRMEPFGTYIIENGETAILWLGGSVSPQLLQDLYGVDDLRAIDTRVTRLPHLPTLLSQQVRNLMEELSRRQRGRDHVILIARQGIDGTEMEFANMLVEDNNNDSLNYADFLCLCHKQIQTALLGEKQAEQQAENAMFRGMW